MSTPAPQKAPLVITPMHLSILLAHMLRSPEVLHGAAGALQPTHLVDPRIGGLPCQAFTFASIQEHFVKFQVAPDMPALQAGILGIIKFIDPFPQPGSLTDQVRTWLTEFASLCTIVGDNSQGLAQEVMVHIHDVCVYKSAVKDDLQAALASGDYSGLDSRLALLDGDHQALKGAESIVPDFDFAAVDGSTRVPTCIPFFDRCFGDGRGLMAPGLCVIFAPQGAGKTTLGTQICISQAQAGYHTVLCLAEGGWEDRGIQLNTMAAATGVSTKHLESSACFEEACKKEGVDHAAALTRHAAVKERMHILDLAKSGGGLPEIESHLASLHRKGIHPVSIYVDWAGIIADGMIARDSERYKDKRTALEVLSSTLAKMATRYRILIFLSHQMGAAYAAKGRHVSMNVNMGHESKMMTADAKYVIGLTGPGSGNETNGAVQVVEFVKARNDANRVRMLVERTGPYCVFKERLDVVEKGRRIVAAKADDNNKIPEPKGG